MTKYIRLLFQQAEQNKKTLRLSNTVTIIKDYWPFLKKKPQGSICWRIKYPREDVYRILFCFCGHSNYNNTTYYLCTARNATTFLPIRCIKCLLPGSLIYITIAHRVSIVGIIMAQL